MPSSLRVGLGVTDMGFLVYWALAALSHFGVIAIPAEWMYADYDQPQVIAWNWSFLPMDLAFSWFGLRAIGRARAGRPWRGHALVSLTLTMAAGGMAVSYWTLVGEFDPGWFGTNALLVVWPLFFMKSMLEPEAA